MILNSFLFIISLAAASLSFPAPHFWFGPLAWIAFAYPIFINEKLEPKKALVINYIFFSILMLSLFWLNLFVESRRLIGGEIFVIIIAALFLFPLAFTLVLAAAKYLGKKAPDHLKPLIYAGSWWIFEYALTLPPLTFPLSLAVSQANLPFLIQTVPFFGIFGISFLIIFVNSSLALAIYKKKPSLAAIGIGFFVFNFAFGIVSLSLNAPQPNGNFKLVLIQPNISWEKNELTRNRFFLNLAQERLASLSKFAIEKNHPDLVIWPELSVDCYLLQTDEEFVSKAVSHLKTPLLIGTQFYDHFVDKPANVAVLISRTGNTLGIYAKEKLFPFSETGRCKRGEDNFPFSIDGTSAYLGPMICFDSLFPQPARKMVSNGANLLVLLSNDAWFGNSRWPWFHMSYIVFRAVENNCWAIHLNNTGPSVVVSPRGIMGKPIPFGKTAISFASIPLPSAPIK